MLANKARERLALVKVYQNNLDEAQKLFGDLHSQSADWRHRTYASHWIQRISRLSADRRALVDCGTKALAYVLRQQGRAADARQIEALRPPSERGYSIQSLVDLAARHGYELAAIQITPADLGAIPPLHSPQGSGMIPRVSRRRTAATLTGVGS